MSRDTLREKEHTNQCFAILNMLLKKSSWFLMVEYLGKLSLHVALVLQNFTSHLFH